MENCFWDDIVAEFDELSIVPKENSFNKKTTTYTDIHHRFIHSVLNVEGFDGDPCCSREAISEVSLQLQNWLKNNPNTDWEDNETFVNHVDILTSDEIKDLAEYISILDKNDCVMWFSW